MLASSTEPKRESHNQGNQEEEKKKKEEKKMPIKDPAMMLASLREPERGGDDQVNPRRKTK
jgi:hypothetical protein